MTITDTRVGQDAVGAHERYADSGTTSLQANDGATPMLDVPAGDQLASGQILVDTQKNRAAGSFIPADQSWSDPQPLGVGGEQTEDGSAATNQRATPIHCPSLADPFLSLAADVLDDTERTKIANENRLRQLTRSAVDSDGEERGFGLDESHPDVARLAALVEMLGNVEHQAVLQLQRKMRAHPLGPWVKAQKGVGDKQAARLLATIGDPYWNTLHDRPRTVSELWAYCGLHTLPASQSSRDTQTSIAGGDSSPAGGDHETSDTQAAAVAARRQKGQKANWSTLAKTRAYLISESMLRAGNRDVYDARKAATEGRLHAAPCVRCGPKGKPAQPGSPWSDGHRHADALRIQSKDLLKNLWREAKRLHETLDGGTR
jgi:hypothetical protein